MTFRRHLLARNRVRMSRRDLQRDVLDQLLEFLLARGFGLARADFDEHADFRAGVNVTGNQSVAGHLHFRVAGDFDVLADFRDERLAFGFQTGLGIGGQPLRHFLAKRAEQLVARDEIGLAVDLHQHAEFSTGRDVLGDGAFLGLAHGFHGGGGLAFFTQDVHGGLEVALRLGERLFAIHHAHVRHFAKFGNVSSSNLRHI